MSFDIKSKKIGQLYNLLNFLNDIEDLEYNQQVLVIDNAEKILQFGSMTKIRQILDGLFFALNNCKFKIQIILISQQ